MKLSTKGRYAVTAMMHLAIHGAQTPITLAEISTCQGISLSYLEQLFAKLRRRGLVEGVRGPGGGYRLAVPAQQVTIAKIINAVDERMDITRCCGKENCQNGQRCLTHHLWSDLSEQIFSFLEGISLAQFTEHPALQNHALLHQHQQRRQRGQAMKPLPIPVNPA